VIERAKAEVIAHPALGSLREGTAPANAAVAIAQVGKSYANGYVALAGVSLSIARGEIVSLIGPSGCGKSTLLNLIAGLDAPSEGSVMLFGRPVTGPSPEIGYMFQKTTLMPWRTVEQNIELPLDIRGVTRDQARAQSHEWVRRVGLKGFEQQYVHQLSGGMQKRVELAQSLIGGPELLLMDEPFAALDALTRYRMQQEVVGLCESMAKTMVFVTHDLDEALAVSDRVALMTAGPSSGIRAVFDIDIPRPRDLRKIKTAEKSARLAAEIWDLLEVEFRKSEQRT
jgi:NitT/TauT family transport system ATP-binding protein